MKRRLACIAVALDGSAFQAEKEAKREQRRREQREAELKVEEAFRALSPDEQREVRLAALILCSLDLARQSLPFIGAWFLAALLWMPSFSDIMAFGAGLTCFVLWAALPSIKQLASSPEKGSADSPGPSGETAS